MGEEEQVYAENKIKIVKEIFDLCQVKSSREKVHKLRKGFLLERYYKAFKVYNITFRNIVEDTELIMEENEKNF